MWPGGPLLLLCRNTRAGHGEGWNRHSYGIRLFEYITGRDQRVCVTKMTPVSSGRIKFGLSSEKILLHTRQAWTSGGVGANPSSNKPISKRHCPTQVRLPNRWV